MTLSGSCLCGGVRYEVTEPLGRIINCHCSICRKSTGAAFRTRAAVRTEAFRWVSGEGEVVRYESSPGEERTFCRICGSTLPTFFRDHPEQIGLPLGTLDDDPGKSPTGHVWVGSKASWWKFTDSQPQHEEGLELPKLE